jgi:hypothetical protein
MAAAAPGSKIIVCTDGLANVGLGALDELGTDAEVEAASELYASLGRRAAAAGVTVDIVAIGGDGCDVENIGTLAEAAGGSVEKIDPLQLTSEFGNILAEPVLATNVSVKVLLGLGRTIVLDILKYRGTEYVRGSGVKWM